MLAIQGEKKVPLLVRNASWGAYAQNDTASGI